MSMSQDFCIHDGGWRNCGSLRTKGYSAKRWMDGETRGCGCMGVRVGMSVCECVCVCVCVCVHVLAFVPQQLVQRGGSCGSDKAACLKAKAPGKPLREFRVFCRLTNTYAAGLRAFRPRSQERALCIKRLI